MRRRTFLLAMGSAIAWPGGAYPQRRLPVLGILGSGSLKNFTKFMEGFYLGLKETGFIADRDFTIDQVWADGNYDRVRQNATDLAGRKPDVVFAQGNPASLELIKVTGTIPIVFNVGLDPVRYKLVTAMNRPGQNATGTILFTSDLVTKRMEILAELLPAAKRFSFLGNPKNPNFENDTQALAASADVLKREIILYRASSDDEIAAAFDKMKQDGIEGVCVSTDAYYFDRAELVVSAAARNALPTIYDRSNYTSAGGLIAYGTSFFESYRHAGALAGRILKGEKPADLPVELPTKFEFVINLKTAKLLGIAVSSALVARADEIIE